METVVVQKEDKVSGPPNDSNTDDINTLHKDEARLQQYISGYQGYNYWLGQLKEFLSSLQWKDPQIAFMELEEKGGVVFDETYNADLKVKAGGIQVGADYVNIIAGVQTNLNKGTSISLDDATQLKKLLDFLKNADSDPYLDKDARGLVAKSAQSIIDILGDDPATIQKNMQQMWFEASPTNRDPNAYGKTLNLNVKECYDNCDQMNTAAGSNRQVLNAQIQLLTNYDKEFLSLFDNTLKQHNNLVSSMIRNKAS